MTLSDALAFISSNILTPLFNFDLSFWGISFGAIVVALFGLPILAKAWRKFF